MTVMHREFTGTVESLATDGPQVVATFVEAPGGYPVRAEPEELVAVLRQALSTGRPVRVTCEMGSREIVDAILD